MKLEGSTLVYLNTVCGMIFILLTILRFGTIWVTAIFLLFAVSFLVGVYARDRYLLKRLREGRPVGTRGVQEANRFTEGSSLILNVAAILVLWFPFLPPQPDDTLATVVANSWLFYFFFILARDFAKLGEELAKRGYWRRVSSEPCEEPE